MKNPVNLRSIAMLSPIYLGAPIIGFIWICLEDGFDWFAIAIAIAIGVLLFIILPGHMEFVERPKEVEVTDSGVTFHQRLGRKPVFVPWPAMRKLNIPPAKPGKKDRSDKNGYLFIAEKKTFTINRKIAEIIQENYRARVGMWLLNEYSISESNKVRSGPYSKY